MARAAGLPHSILHHKLYIQICTQRISTKCLREDQIILWIAERKHTHVVRPRLLREPGGEAMVGAVPAAALAGYPGTFHQRWHTGSGRDWKADAAQHNAVLHPGLRHHHDACLLAGQETLPHLAACRGLWSHARKRKESVREDGRQESNVQVLDAIGVGDEHHQPGEEGGSNCQRPHCSDPAGGTI